MRIPYLVIINDDKSFVYTDKRKIKKISNKEDNIKIYTFKTIDKYNYWKDTYELYKNGEETKAKIFKEDGMTYSDLGCNIMKHLARAKWNSSIKYPDNGWHICSVCGDITNTIDKCWNCDEFVCWECSNEVNSDEWDEGDYCSYECRRKYTAKELGIEYNPEKEYKESVINRFDDILRNFEREELFNILVKVEVSIYDYDEEDVENELNKTKLEYINMSKKELLSNLSVEDDEDIFEALMELYKEKTDNELDFILDGESFINNLDPNDPNDEWYFED